MEDETREELQEAINEDFAEIQVIADELKELYYAKNIKFDDWQIQMLAMQYFTAYTYNNNEA